MNIITTYTLGSSVLATILAILTAVTTDIYLKAPETKRERPFFPMFPIGILYILLAIILAKTVKVTGQDLLSHWEAAPLLFSIAALMASSILSLAAIKKGNFKQLKKITKLGLVDGLVGWLMAGLIIWVVSGFFLGWITGLTIGITTALIFGSIFGWKAEFKI